MSYTLVTMIKSKPAYLALCLALVVAAVLASVSFTEATVAHRSLIGSFKFLATMAIALYAFVSLSRTSLRPLAATFLVIALVCEALCDFLIEFSFVLGGTFSLIGMVCYSLCFLQYRESGRASAINAAKVALPAVALTSVFFAVQFGLLSLTGGAFLVGTDGVFLIYMFILSLTAAISYGYPAPAALRAAITIFYVSDYVVYFQMALGHRPAFRIANALLYYGAQACFVFFVFNPRSAEVKSDTAEIR
jgi:YhhN family